jgi:GT2 family glycosyltransferase
LISLLVPLYNTPPDYLGQMIASVLAQTYQNWELCLADASDNEHAWVAEICAAAALSDTRLHYLKLSSNAGISANTNAALSLASGSYLALLDHDDVLHPSALFEIVRVINGRAADLIYSDETCFELDPAKAFYPHFKPDFSPDMLRSYNYITHLAVFSRELLDKVGVLRPAYDGSQDYDLILRLSEQAQQIVHIPKALYYWRQMGDSFSSEASGVARCMDAAHRALDDHLSRLGLAGRAEDGPLVTTYRIRYQLPGGWQGQGQGAALVSILIPTKDHREDLEKCLRSIRTKTSYRNFEVIVIENNSTEAETFAFYQSLAATWGEASAWSEGPGQGGVFSQSGVPGQGGVGKAGRAAAPVQAAAPPLKIITYDGPFNFSAINNFAAGQANGDYLLFLNNDTEVISPDWLQEMLMFAQRSDVGAVGAKLFYPDETVQHAGVVLGIGGVAGHSHRGFKRDDYGYANRLQVVHNVSAVTGACMLVPAALFASLGGFDESLAVAFNDIDLCLRITAGGYRIVFTPYAELYHHESKSRGYEDSPEKMRRFREEARRFRLRWEKQLAAGDPCYNPNLTLVTEDFAFAITQGR